MSRLLLSRVAAGLLLFSIAALSQTTVTNQSKKKTGSGKQAVKSQLGQKAGATVPSAASESPQPSQNQGDSHNPPPPTPDVTATLLQPATNQTVRVNIAWVQSGVHVDTCSIAWGDGTANDVCGQDYTDHTYTLPKQYLIQVTAVGYANDEPFSITSRVPIAIEPSPSETVPAQPAVTPTSEGKPKSPRPRPIPPQPRPSFPQRSFWSTPFGLVQWILLIVGAGLVVWSASKLFHARPRSAELHVRGFAGTSDHKMTHIDSSARELSLMFKPGTNPAEHNVVFLKRVSASE